ncbi:MAG: radical SAM protein [Pirellulaceae bacterium]
MARIAFISPRFDVSYWGLQHALPYFGKRANLPVACLPLLAALTPDEHEVVLFDENVEELDFDLLATFDIVGVTGMIVQRFRMREILTELKHRDAFAVVGGPWITVNETYFGDLPDVIFVGEAEETWPQFLLEWKDGRHGRRYEQQHPTDMTKVPTPRNDLIASEKYMFGSLQFSRGCPFQCEFCDIIVIFGRRPRLKTSRQLITELESHVAEGMDTVFVVDDNLIGNKKAIKSVLRDVADWQRRRGYPLTFFTEASLDLADDAELMQLMVEANFVSVFIGIESPNEESLRETKKFQNVRQGGSILEKIHRVQMSGLDVWCGMIVGFDHDDATIFDRQREFLRDSRIAHAMLGMLHAIPTTPLYNRLIDEGRLDPSDEPEFGTNVIPQAMTREELREGYVQVTKELYEPDAYFKRVDDLYLNPKFRFGTAKTEYLRRRPIRRMVSWLHETLKFKYVAYRVTHDVPNEALRREYKQRIRNFCRHQKDPSARFVYAVKCAIHFHHHRMAQEMADT